MDGTTVRIYLDNCMFNRHFDDQSQIRVRLETEAKLYIQDAIQKERIELVWSYILSAENAANPHDERRNVIQRWRSFAVRDIAESDSVIIQMNQLIEKGIKAKDSLHVASAIEGKANFFLTTDDQLLMRLKPLNLIDSLNPVDFVREME